MFSRLCLLTLCSLLLVPASAPAAELTETRTTSLEGSSYCVQSAPSATDTLTVWPPQLLQATPAGFVASDTVPIERAASCLYGAARPSGAGVMVGEQFDRDAEFLEEPDRIVARVRDPGGNWSAPAVLARTGAAAIAVDVSDRGDAVVAWLEIRSEFGDHVDTRINVARHQPGGGFGAPQIVANVGVESVHELAVGLGADGEVIVMWTRSGSGDRTPLGVLVEAAIAPATGAFTAAVPIGEISALSTPTLAVAPDGRAMIALPDKSSIFVAERPPGGAFGAPVRVAGAVDSAGVQAAVALGAGGEAAVAWRGFAQGGAGVVTRGTPGGFGPPIALVQPEAIAARDRLFYSETYRGRLYMGPIPSDEIRAIAAPGGRVALAWIQPDGAFGRSAAMLATVPFTGGPAVVRVASRRLGRAEAVYPLVLAGEALALAWTGSIDDNRYRLHLAAEGASAAPQSPMPRLRVGAPAHSLLKPGAGLELPVTCSAPCVVDAHVLGGSDAGGELELEQGGTGRLWMTPGEAPIAPRRAGAVRVRLSYGALDGTSPMAERTVTVRLRRDGEANVPRVIGLRVVRHRSAIRVTWRMDRALANALFVVTGAATRGWSGEPLAIEVDEAGEQATAGTFRVTLHHAQDVRWVTLWSLTTPFGKRRVVLRVP